MSLKKEQEVVQQTNEGASTKDFLLGAVVGSIVGAATALFLAPKPGKELRNDLNGQANVLKAKGIELTGTVKEKGTEFISIAKDKTEQIGDKVTKTSNELMDKVKGLNSNKPVTSDSLEEQEEEAEELTIAPTSLETDYDGVQQKLEETKKAFDDTESKYN